MYQEYTDDRVSLMNMLKTDSLLLKTYQRIKTAGHGCQYDRYSSDNIRSPRSSYWTSVEVWNKGKMSRTSHYLIGEAKGGLEMNS